MVKRVPIVISFLLVISIVLIPNVQKVSSDGLFEETLPPASIGDRVASLYTKISPPILTSDAMQNAFLQLRLFDSNTGNNITNVNYFLTINKGDEVLFRELFYSKQGPLTLKFQPSEGPIRTFGTTEPFLGGWTSDTGDISIVGPVLSEGGLYHFAIEIFGIDNVRNIFQPENAPRFDSYLSIGDVHTANVTYANKDYNSTLISYYDKAQNFTFEPENLKVKWEMPFNWNVSRIKANNIFVHEEISIPKPSPFANQSYSGQVNGIPLPAKMLMVDPTNSSRDVVHFMIPKDGIISLAENVNRNGTATSGLMKFELKPGGNLSSRGSIMNMMNMNTSSMSS
ncbi:MAG TPA: hypothetical protein VD694_06775 [Nitrososphaeraceae archaeon]|nr:hypothetical protein [Nitrososphaeraceae archaeon]